MKLKLTIKRKVPIPLEILEVKIIAYLKKNFYRIIESSSNYIIFTDDEYSARKRRRSDYHTRIGEGKFEFNAEGEDTVLILTYLTPVLYPAFLMMLFIVTGIYIKSFMPIVLSFAFYLPILCKIYYMKERIFNDILEC